MKPATLFLSRLSGLRVTAVRGALAVVALAGLLGGPAAWAERADRDKPMNIEADTLRHDDLRRISIFTGKVVLTKGTLLVRGARLEVREDAQGYQFATVTAEPGKRAFYRQKREGVDEFIEGESQLIEYDGRNDRVTFTRDAEIRRLRGTTLSDQINGSVIVYDNVNDAFAVDGAAVGERGRVRATLSPRNRDTAPPATSPAAPALKPSPALGGARP